MSVDHRGFWFDQRGTGSGHFGGPSAIGCPSCGRPLLNIVTLSDPNALSCLGWKQSELRVLFCWRCRVSQGPFVYDQSEGSFQIVRHESGNMSDDFPYEAYPIEVPFVDFALKPLPKALAELQLDFNDDVEWPHYLTLFLETPRSQVLGRPFIYEGHVQACPRCEGPMNLTLTIDNDIGAGYIQTEDSSVVLVVWSCNNCSIVQVAQQCD